MHFLEYLFRDFSVYVFPLSFELWAWKRRGVTFSSCDCTIIRGMEPILITSSDIRIIVDPFLFVSRSLRHRFSVWSFTYMEFDMTKNIILLYVTMLHIVKLIETTLHNFSSSTSSLYKLIWHEMDVHIFLFFLKKTNIFVQTKRVKWHVGFVAAHKISGSIFCFSYFSSLL